MKYLVPVILIPQCNLDLCTWVHSLVTCPLRPRFPVNLFLCCSMDQSSFPVPQGVSWYADSGLRTLDEIEDQSSSFSLLFLHLLLSFNHPMYILLVLYPLLWLLLWFCFAHLSPRCGYTQRFSCGSVLPLEMYLEVSAKYWYGMVNTSVMFRGFRLSGWWRGSS